jgi:hypothetical protein
MLLANEKASSRDVEGRINVEKGKAVGFGGKDVGSNYSIKKQFCPSDDRAEISLKKFLDRCREAT